MPITLHEKAVVGRRVEYAYHQDVYLPGIITAITDDAASVRVRLDGTRSNLACRPDYEGLRYLDDVTPVPVLPMGRFQPTHRDLDGNTYRGVPACEFEDGDIVLLTSDPAAARAALLEYFRVHDLDPDYGLQDPDLLELRWAVFQWQPEDAECPWLATFDAEGADMAVQIHYLPS
ncbi:hypothetical protein [Streptomyces sp. NBC_01353]|uniref:hypothetical protein n=1 Tax=Streptomyces sp. NBC_01353 TaxID=2903835 RepID=UPI002E305BC7|nr:hypothetical protein [Streptomyces sp. NBC_01353]